MKRPPETALTPIFHYFVDEAGDLSLFDKRGRSIVGREGVSHTFIVGAALVPDPPALAADLEALRADLVADPYFSKVPSLSLQSGKTARAFHAKDDLPEVRREVFRLLANSGAQIFAGIRRKRALAAAHAGHFQRTGRKLGPDAVYDDLVSLIFLNRLHQSDENHIVFARRGKADRNIALSKAIDLAKYRFEGRWRKGIDRPTTVSSSTPSETVCLQVVDYYLWALQRLVERREERFFASVADQYRLIIDCDDTRERGSGVYYTASGNRLRLERLMPVT